MHSSGPGFLPTFLYYFVGTTVIVAIVAVQGLGMSLETGNPYQLGLPVGLVAGLIGAYFNRSIVVTVPFPHRGTFLKTLKQALTQLGYAETDQLDEFTVYERSGLSKVFSGRLFIQVEKTSAAIAGRSRNVKALRKLIDCGTEEK
jgi:hypothetical protein